MGSSSVVLPSSRRVIMVSFDSSINIWAFGFSSFLLGSAAMSALSFLEELAHELIHQQGLWLEILILSDDEAQVVASIESRHLCDRYEEVHRRLAILRRGETLPLILSHMPQSPPVVPLPPHRRRGRQSRVSRSSSAIWATTG